MAGGNASRTRERSRCAAIVRDKRQEIEHKLIANYRRIWKLSAHMEAKKYIRRFIQVLTEIEHQILEIKTAAIAPQVEYLGDFSEEEMERAQAIIAEQEYNPFEVT